VATKVLIIEDPQGRDIPLEMHLRRERGDAFQSTNSIPSAVALMAEGEVPDICVIGAEKLPKSLPCAHWDGLSEVPIAVLQSQPTLWTARGALKVGAAGVIMRNESPRTILRALRFIISGERYLSAQLLGDDAPLVELSLSAREMQVLESICKGLTNKEIALALSVQEVTIKLHVKAVCRKLNARNRTHAAMIARDLGLV